MILNWNNAKNTLHCLESIKTSDYKQYQILVVDNGSTDESAAVLHRAYPDLTIIETGQNLGYTGGNNAGIKYFLNMGVDYILLLNDDVVLEPPTLTFLTATASAHPQAGFLGPMIFAIGKADFLLSAGGTLEDGYIARHNAIGQLDPANHDDAYTFDFISGCAMMVKRELIESVGLLDEDYFLYYEEIDWCYRGQQGGYEIRLAPKARIWHPDTYERDKDSPLVTYYSTRNRLLFARKHKLGWVVTARLMAGYSRQLLSWSLRPRWREKSAQRQALAQAMLDFLHHRNGEWQSW